MGHVRSLAALLVAGAAIATATALFAADPQAKTDEPAWKSSPFHGVISGDGTIIPCRCLYRGMAYRLGEKVCMSTHLGTVITECDLIQNNTSWIPSNEPCTVSLSRTLRLAELQRFCRPSG
jgi:hypothetical protein